MQQGSLRSFITGGRGVSRSAVVRQARKRISAHLTSSPAFVKSHVSRSEQAGAPVFSRCSHQEPGDSAGGKGRFSAKARDGVFRRQPRSVVAIGPLQLRNEPLRPGVIPLRTVEMRVVRVYIHSYLGEGMNEAPAHAER